MECHWAALPRRNPSQRRTSHKVQAFHPFLLSHSPGSKHSATSAALHGRRSAHLLCQLPCRRRSWPPRREPLKCNSPSPTSLISPSEQNVALWISSRSLQSCPQRASSVAELHMSTIKLLPQAPCVERKESSKTCEA